MAFHRREVVDRSHHEIVRLQTELRPGSNALRSVGGKFVDVHRWQVRDEPVFEGQRARMHASNLEPGAHDDVGKTLHRAHGCPPEDHGRVRVEYLPDDRRSGTARRQRTLGVVEPADECELGPLAPNRVLDATYVAREIASQSQVRPERARRANPAQGDGERLDTRGPQPLGCVSRVVR